MEILIHSLLDKVRKFNASLHIRYYADAHFPGERTGSDPQRREDRAPERTTAMTSYVIIRREFSYLEPVIRSLFDEAKDVTVFIDRRVDDRRENAPPEEEDRRRPSNRRASRPMMDIIINVES